MISEDALTKQEKTLLFRMKEHEINKYKQKVDSIFSPEKN